LFKVPFEAIFIENQLVVTMYTSDLERIQKKIQIGDVITKINGETVEKIVERLLPYIPASNYAVKLRDISPLILRTNETTIKLTIFRDGQIFEKQIPTYDSKRLKIPNYFNSKPNDEGYSVLYDSIGIFFLLIVKWKNRIKE
jgi:C-terminal processing protease CtpA/Prc